MRAVSKSSKGPSTIEVIEESVHLLRSNSGALAYYYAGTGLFALSVLYFGRQIVHFKPDDAAILLISLLLVAVFFAMKACQRRFALLLHADFTNSPLPVWSFKDWVRIGLEQFKLHALGLWILPISMAVTVPFGWVYAYFQTLTVQAPVLDETIAHQRKRAWEKASLWPKQNHLALLILSLLWLTLYLNLVFTFIILPFIFTSFLGSQGLYMLAGWNYFSRFYLITLLVFTHVLVDPLVKTFYLIRSFHAEARTTGADLRRSLRRENRASKGIVLTALLFGLFILSSPHGLAAEPVAGEKNTARPSAASSPKIPGGLRDEKEIRESIDRALQGSHFDWEIPREHQPDETKEKGLLYSSIKHLLGGIKTAVEWLRDKYRDVVDWLKHLRPETPPPAGGEKAASKSSVNWASSLHWFAYLILGGVALVFLLVLYRLATAKRVQASPPETLPLLNLPPTLPDLTKEDVNATQLPADGWLELARRLLEKGEWRLCQRALFLATLSRRAQEGLLSLAAHKTNSEYERELRRRASGRTQILEDFHQRRRLFESCWYGNSDVNPDAVRTWLEALEVRS